MLSCLWLCDLMNCRPPGSSVLGILQARILEWVAYPFSRGYSQARCQTGVSCTAYRFFAIWVIREAALTSKGIKQCSYMGRTRYISKTESTLFFFNSCLELVEKEEAKNGIVVSAWETRSGDNYGRGHLEEQSSVRLRGLHSEKDTQGQPLVGWQILLSSFWQIYGLREQSIKQTCT